MYGIIKTEERNEGILVLVLNFLGCFLEAGKHGTFTAGQMLAGITMLADFCKNLLHDDELIRHKWEIHGKFSGTRITFNIQNGVCETEQITENGVVLLINCFQFGLGFIVLFQNTLLNDFIHRGGRKAQTGFESSLNSGELVSTDFNNFINGFLSGADNPHLTTALTADFLNEGLEIQKHIGIRSDILTHFVHHKQQTEVVRFSI